MSNVLKIETATKFDHHLMSHDQIVDRIIYNAFTKEHLSNFNNPMAQYFLHIARVATQVREAADKIKNDKYEIQLADRNMEAVNSTTYRNHGLQYDVDVYVFVTKRGDIIPLMPFIKEHLSINPKNIGTLFAAYSNDYGVPTFDSSMICLVNRNDDLTFPCFNINDFFQTQSMADRGIHGHANLINRDGVAQGLTIKLTEMQGYDYEPRTVAGPNGPERHDAFWGFARMHVQSKDHSLFNV